MRELTEVHYLYRDASNYKFRGQFNLLGRLRADELATYLIDEEFFVPETIGLPALRPLITNNDDHLFHEIEECREIAGEQFEMTVDEFKERVAKAAKQGWF